jgi:hypothetical protein
MCRTLALSKTDTLLPVRSSRMPTPMPTEARRCSVRRSTPTCTDTHTEGWSPMAKIQTAGADAWVVAWGR